MSHIKAVSSKIRVEQARMVVIALPETPLPPTEDQLYTIANEPMVAIDGEKLVPIE